MKKLLFLLLVVSMTACKNYVQLFETSTNSPRLKEDEGLYVYETDTMKITYSFWVEKSIMAFAIYNKLDVPPIH